MDRMKLYEGRYNLEWEHRAHLLNLTNLCIVASTIIGTALVTGVQLFNYETAGVIRLFFLVCSGISSVAIFVSFFFICWSLIDRGYSHFPNPSDIEKHYSRIRKWAAGSVEAEVDPGYYFQDTLHNRP